MGREAGWQVVRPDPVGREAGWRVARPDPVTEMPHVLRGFQGDAAHYM